MLSPLILLVSYVVGIIPILLMRKLEEYLVQEQPAKSVLRLGSTPHDQTASLVLILALPVCMCSASSSLRAYKSLLS